MKKAIVFLSTLGLTLGLMAGCGKDTPFLTATDYEIDEETHQTNSGVSIGDSPEAFLLAYGEYGIFTSLDGGEYQAVPTDQIPFDAAITTLLPTFYVDGTPIDPGAFCEENEIDKADLVTFLSSDQYLSSHTVVYYYMVFTWENGAIADIRSEYMDYNEVAAFYKEYSP